MRFMTAARRVAGLGAAHDGTHHFISQRLTALALLFLLPAFLIPFMRALGAGHQAMIETYRDPFHALVAIGVFVIGFRHLRLGLQVVIEDYVHSPATRLALLIWNALFWRGLGAAAAFAVALIAFSA